ncbi:hypothetical protein BCAR13_440146 [Paraburkholderia caribensis]|nr:hypothetical protein BCAR13_440146 [Paraburkholderia caribensis]
MHNPEKRLSVQFAHMQDERIKLSRSIESSKRGTALNVRAVAVLGDIPIRADWWLFLGDLRLPYDACLP